MNIEQIKLYYSKMDIDQLEKLVDEIAGLRKVAIPILKAELEKRNELSLLDKINQYENLLKLKDKTVLDQHVKERLDSGEPMESIVFDLKNKGIDLVSLAYDKEIKIQKISDEIIEMKSEAYKRPKVKRRIIKKHELDEKEYNEIEDRIKSKSKYNFILGYLLVILGVIFIILSHSRKGIVPFILIITGGLKLITLGFKQKNIEK